ncbi:uncharacterized protein LOC142008014 [Carettochelys insculpta]|uniref:uncharacterized protein LOC142008014 n=1 Tax=Carettochelys insculpta TaxID=44489 RepID=UPI003EB994CE
MESKRRNADALARLAEGLATRGHPAHTPDHVRSKVKELQQGYTRAQDAASQSAASPPTCLFYRELRSILGPRYTSSLSATLDTSANESQQAPEAESAPEASPAPQGPPQDPTPGMPEEEEGESSSSDRGLQIILPSQSSSRVSAQRVSPDRGSRPSAAPSEGPESASEVSVVPESPPGPSQQASPSAEHRPAPGWGRQRSHHHPRMATDPPAARDPPASAGGVGAAPAGGRVAAGATRAGTGLAPGGMGGLYAHIRAHSGIPGPHAALLCSPCPPLHLLLRPPSHRRPPPQGLPPRGTWGLLTPAGHTCRFSRPPASLGQGSGRGKGRARQPQAPDSRGVQGPGHGPPPPVYISPPI